MKDRYVCPACSGSGFDPEAKLSQYVSIQTPCPICAGEGYIILKPSEEPIIPDKPLISWPVVWNAMGGTAVVIMMLISIWAATTNDWQRASFNVEFAALIILVKIWVHLKTGK